MISIFMRSLVFNVGFYLSLLVHMVAAIPSFFLPRQVLFSVAKSWAHSMTWMLRVFCNIRVEYRGLDKIPQGPLLVVAKHQSAWETVALLPLFREPLFILKRELTWIPLFGLFLLKGQMIPVNRAAGARALSKMTALARERVRHDRQLIIFPEGTRRPVGAEPRYKYGVAQVYVDCGVRCLPVALNSGLFWPRRTFLRYPGTIIVEFLDLIPPGLSRDEFLARASDVIETATAKLVAEGRQERARLIGDLAPLDEPVAEA
ncbi:lysophospholipid acyltransferase family protein [Bradyrhizobium sp. LHD-71]|uniref:lysophospholipid acyltransferase family protein n=1 Tax=Bradyrhizobium sp. LHD-71 TaxID=3072141 RepID=UPI0028105FC2|nr:lysophospholipid acyltransferase family protein [Bradyrhizobium sp. LHD-71]MDQ8730575.1 lysophospholipid acyltransferase family protein [Bradyrhizobium sp. LHD-71]